VAGKGDPIVWGIVGFVGGLALLYNGIRRYQFRQKICNTPTSKIAAAAMGAVEVYGKVKPVEPLKSPANGADCTYYCTEVFRWQKSGKHSKWVRIKFEIKGITFVLEDETGSVIVDSDKAQLEMPADYTFETGGQDESALPERVRNLFDAWGVKYQYAKVLGIITPREKLKVVEKYLAVGDLVYVFGTMQPAKGQPAGNPSVKDAYIGAKGGEFFYISDSPEKEIIGKMFTDVPLWVGGGILASCVGLGIILWRIGVK
jgi:hypothetical protein